MEKIYETLIHDLESNLIMALGCTEPIAIALTAAKAREVLGTMPERMVLTLSGNIIKNARSVTVPNSGGMKGIEAAASLGVIGGKPEKQLEVLADIKEEQWDRAKEFQKNIQLKLGENCPDVYVEALAISGKEKALVKLAHEHNNICHIEKNGEILCSENLEASKDFENPDCSIRDIYQFVEEIDLKKHPHIIELLDRQMKCNREIAHRGMEENYGANVGKTILSYQDPTDVKVLAKAYAAAGSDARMGGCPLPVVINSGSGNQGVTVSVPVMVYGEMAGVDKDKLYRALLLSNLLAIHQKKFIGKLSAFCGVVSAAASSGAAIGYLMDFDFDQIAQIITTTIATTGGMVCDGAKASCATKISMAVENAILATEMVRRGNTLESGDGIVDVDVDHTIYNIGRMAKKGMKSTDREILEIMIDA
ncbi:MAG: L-serine ammonia-lyase, iron-sulfur-dependent, subunit alpha [Tissierellia bacterium]|nr:L-serine ammonia-lyase, iron-sulfur-dependent, subunit alpha [Tissierellia bacterium]